MSNWNEAIKEGKKFNLIGSVDFPRFGLGAHHFDWTADNWRKAGWLVHEFRASTVDATKGIREVVASPKKLKPWTIVIDPDDETTEGCALRLATKDPKDFLYLSMVVFSGAL